MGLILKVAPEFHLDLGDDRSVTLPPIAVVPTTENMPHIKKFEVEVVGRSAPLSQEREVERVAELLRLGYPKLDYRPGKEVPLRQQMTVPLNRVVLEGRVPAGARFTLTAQVWYYDSDAQGRSNAGAGAKGPVRASSVLSLSPQAGAPQAQAQTAGPCRIEVEPAQLTLVDRGDMAALAVRITNRPTDLLPRLVLADLFTDAPELSAALTGLLAGGLKRSPDAVAGEWEVWRAELALQLEPDARRALWERSQGGALEVGARVEVPGKAACEFHLRLMCQEDVFKGLVAMDFGTSNSTVTLYDPGVVEDLT